jgi:hypothetical protein
MKPARREWALIAAFFLFQIFVYSQYAFMTGTAVNPQRISQLHVSGTVGMVLGALLLPLLLPFGDLRERANQRFGRTIVPKVRGSQPSRYSLRLVLVGFFFLPNIIFRLQGPQAWLASSFSYRFMAAGNGVVTTLMIGCIVSLARKYRVFWFALAVSGGLFCYHLVLGPGRELLLPYMFASAGIALTAAGILLLVFLTGVESRAVIEDHAVAEGRAASQGETSPPPPISVKRLMPGGLIYRAFFPFLPCLSFPGLTVLPTSFFYHFSIPISPPV